MGQYRGSGVGEPSEREREAMCFLESGANLEAQREFEEALACYDRSLELVPELGRGHFCRGNVLLELGRVEEALAAYDRALEIKPDSVGAYYNRGNACAKLKCLDDAEKAYRRALELKPDFVDASVALGAVLEELDKPEEAIASYRKALEFKPDYAEVYFNLGGLFVRQLKREEAEIAFRKAIGIRNDYFEAYLSLGHLLKDLGRNDEVSGLYFRALEIEPRHVPILSALGETLRDLGRVDESVTIYHRALEEEPENEELLNDLGVLQGWINRHGEAVEVYKRALKINPENCMVLANLGASQHSLRLYEDAIASYRKAIELSPDAVIPMANLGSAFADVGKLENAIDVYRRILSIKPDFAVAHSNLLFINNFLQDEPADDLLRDALRYGEIVTRYAHAFDSWPNRRDAERCLRVGFVSGDMRMHPVGYFLEGVLAELSRRAAGRLELLAYATHFVTDNLSERIRSCCSQWQLVSGLSDEALAKRIREDEVDILIDLSGHTAHNRLPVFAWRPAPVQVSWLGYFATTGVSEIDYLIADPWTLPEREEKYFTERIWRLPETRLCFTAPGDDVEVSPLPALSNHCVTFGCFNNLSKMNDEVVALWARVLKAVPGSRLLLKANQIKELSVRLSVVERFSAHGVLENRLVLEGGVPRYEYFQSYGRVDIALDPFPYTGGTTTVESLWMGVPVLTLEGERFLSRQGVGLLMNAGLSEWVAKDKDDFVVKAVAHARSLPRLALLRSVLRKQVLASPIFDAPRFAEHFEEALRAMWKTWCKRQSL